LNNTNDKKLLALLENVRDGKLRVDEATEQLRTLPYEDLGFAKLDHHRSLRQGFPEVVFAQGKTPEQVSLLMKRIADRNGKALSTRANPEVYAAVAHEVPDAVYHKVARLIIIDRAPVKEKRPGILVVTAGTTDIPVAEEAALTAELMGNQVERLFDVGVAGLHRLLDKNENLQRARVIVAVAGMEGALASVIGGLVSAPVIAVPTSIGYGASFGGLAALLAMLNSCANGIAVVNIDNGFGAGYMAGLINQMDTPETLRLSEIERVYAGG
jgi:pyridinium-3,5-biscarboxylic acid mononucleotide synthase